MQQSVELSIERPSILRFVAEPGRALWEWSRYLPYRRRAGLDIEGDGHPVLILPGFMGTNYSTLPIRKFLDKIGYDTYGWALQRNLGKIEYLDILSEQINELHAKHGQELSLVGWSLGGVYARQLAKMQPEKVRQVITMGSPFSNITSENNANWLYKLVTNNKGVSALPPEIIQDIPRVPPVPFTSIYSKIDGVVPWPTCVEYSRSPWVQNIAVRSSHLGLAVNPAALNIVADRLQYHKDNWTHFPVDDMRK